MLSLPRRRRIVFTDCIKNGSSNFLINTFITTHGPRFTIWERHTRYVKDFVCHLFKKKFTFLLFNPARTQIAPGILIHLGYYLSCDGPYLRMYY